MAIQAEQARFSGRRNLDRIALFLVGGLLATLVSVGSSGSAVAAPGAFLESGGVVVMEVESAPLSGSWRKETNFGGYTGSGYYAWRGPDSFSSTSNGVLSYPIKITNAGTYRVDIRSRRDLEGRSSVPNDQENDVWIRMDSGTWKKIYMQGSTPWGTWQYAYTFDINHQHSRAQFSVGSGYHTLQLAGRSARFKIDRIHLHTGANPSHTTPESRREGSTSPPPPTSTTSPPPSGVTNVATDTYTRTVTNAWGTANKGGQWSLLAGATANIDVNGSVGTMVLPGGSQQQLVRLGSTAVKNVDYFVKVGFNSRPNSGGSFAYLVARRQTSGAHYRIGPFIDSAGKVFIRGQNGSNTSLFADKPTGLTAASGDLFYVRVQVRSSSPTTLKAKVWKVGTSQPSTWAVTTTDSSKGPQTAGTLGIRGLNTGSSATMLRFDDLSVNTF